MKFTSSLLLSILVFLSADLSAQQFQPKTILFVGNSEYTDMELMAAAHLKAGAVMTGSEMGDHTKLLLDSGVFDFVSYKFDGLNLVFNLTPAKFMYPIRFSNLPIALTPDLDAELHAKFPLYHGKLPTEGDLVDSIRAELEKKLSAMGIHTSLTVIPYTELAQNKAIAMDFSIPSPPVIVGHISVDGSSPQFISKVQDVAFHLQSQPYDSSNSAQNIQHTIENYYSDQGYAVAKADVTPASTPIVTDANIQIPYSVKIAEGHVYKLGAIHLPPDIPITPEEYSKLLDFKPGDTINGAKIRGVWFFLSNKYKSKGYLLCKVDPTSTVDEAAGTVSYNVTVTLGAQFNFTYVKFDGFSDEMRHTLMSNWKLLPGDPMDLVYVSTFFNKLGNGNFVAQNFKGMNINFVLHTDSVSHEVNVTYKLENAH
jgi:outer membrane protein assembly factor BamA